jgi:hypothetical protein
MLELHAIAGPAFGTVFKMETASASLGQDPARATWAVPADITLLPQHCEFLLEGGAISLRVVSGAFVSVNGTVVREGTLLQTGDTLTTGGSVFSVAVERAAMPISLARVVVDAPPPVPGLPEAPPRTELPKDAVPFIAYTRIDDRRSVVSFLAQQPGNLCAVIDAARSPIIYPLLQQCGEPHVPLFTLEGLPEDLKAFAPYLAQLAPGSVLLQQLVLQGWGDHWCVYLSTPLAFEDVRVHLKKFLMVKLDDREVFFRFYDPRVLRVYLPAITPHEAERFFGGVRAFFCTDAEGACLEYSCPVAVTGAASLASALHRF